MEIVFRERDDDGDWLVWVMIQGEGFPNRPEAEPQLLLLPDPVREAVLRWASPRH